MVTDPGVSWMPRYRWIRPSTYRKCKKRYGVSFQAKTGAEALAEFFASVDLNKKKAQLVRDRYYASRADRARLEARLVDLSILQSNPGLDKLLLTTIPVIPPAARQLLSGYTIETDITYLYRDVIACNRRLRRLLAGNAPQVIRNRVAGLLQGCLDQLIDGLRILQRDIQHRRVDSRDYNRS